MINLKLIIPFLLDTAPDIREFANIFQNESTDKDSNKKGGNSLYYNGSHITEEEHRGSHDSSCKNCNRCGKTIKSPADTARDEEEAAASSSSRKYKQPASLFKNLDAIANKKLKTYESIGSVSGTKSMRRLDELQTLKRSQK